MVDCAHHIYEKDHDFESAAVTSDDNRICKVGISD